MILHRGGIMLEFFRDPNLNPLTSAFGCCLRLDDVGSFFAVILAAGVPETTVVQPRAHRPRREDWGSLVGALIDPDGTLLRLVQEQR